MALHGYLADSHADVEPGGIEGKPVFVGSGRMDEVIPTERAETAADRLRELGADVDSNQYGSAHGIGRDELADIVAWVEARMG